MAHDLLLCSNVKLASGLSPTSHFDMADETGGWLKGLPDNQMCKPTRGTLTAMPVRYKIKSRSQAGKDNSTGGR